MVSVNGVSSVTSLIVVVCIAATACNDNDDQSTQQLLDPSPNSIPNLAPGPHIGYIVGFDALTLRQQVDAENRFSEAVTAGMTVSRVQVDWQELEPQPGNYEAGELMAALDQATVSGQKAFVTLSTLDTGALTLPDDLMSVDQLLPAAGLSLDGPEIRARFESFLDWFMPELARYGVWGVALANEPSNAFDNIDQQEVTKFLVQSADYANSLDENIAVTVTIAGGADNDASKIQFIKDLIPHFDIASYNFYCLGGNNLLTTIQSDWQAAVTTFIARAEGREIFFQELGCPAGWGDLGGVNSPPPETISATPEIQSAFYRFMLNQIETRQELRAATIFQLNDWSPELAKLFADTFRASGEELTGDRLEEWLATVGMCRWSDGQCRDAYTDFLDAARRMATARNSL